MKRAVRTPAEVDVVNISIPSEFVMDNRYVEWLLFMSYVRAEAESKVTQRASMNLKYGKYNTINRYGLEWIDVQEPVKDESKTSVNFNITIEINGSIDLDTFLKE